MSTNVALVAKIRTIKHPKKINSGKSSSVKLSSIKIPKGKTSSKYPKLHSVAAKSKKSKTKSASSISSTLKSLISKAKKAGVSIPNNSPSPDSAPAQPAFFGPINPDALL